MINPNSTYPGLVSTPDASYPYGGAINESASGALDGTPLEQKWVNDFWGSIQRMITLAGIVPSNTAENAQYKGSQVVQAMAAMLLPREFTHEDDTSVVDAYKAKQKSPTPEVAAPFDGMIVVWELPAGLANAGASTFTVDNGTPEAIVTPDGAGLSGGEIQPGKVKLEYDLANTEWILITDIVPLSRGGIDGVITSNSGALDIAVTKGAARSSDNSLDMINTTAAFTKQINNAFAAGSGAGGFGDGAALTNDTWYRFFMIAKLDGTIDFGWDTSATAANLLGLPAASDYVKYRQIAWHYYEAPGQIRSYFQVGDDFFWDEMVQDKNGTVTGTAQLITLTAPPDKNCKATIIHSWEDISGTAGDRYGLLTATRQTDVAATSSNFTYFVVDTTDDEGQAMSLEIYLDDSGQIRSRWDSTLTDIEKINTRGWHDPRGKQ